MLTHNATRGLAWVDAAILFAKRSKNTLHQMVNSVLDADTVTLNFIPMRLE